VSEPRTGDCSRAGGGVPGGCRACPDRGRYAGPPSGGRGRAAGAVSQRAGKPNSVPLAAPPASRSGHERWLGATIIPLGASSLTPSSDLPGGIGRATLERLPIWSCSVRGLACHSRCRERGALLPHLFTLTRRRPPRLAVAAIAGGRYVFCATFRRVAPPGCYPAHCPAEFGLSSRRLDRRAGLAPGDRLGPLRHTPIVARPPQTARAASGPQPHRPHAAGVQVGCGRAR